LGFAHTPVVHGDMRANFISPRDNLLNDIRVFFHHPTQTEEGCLTLCFIKQAENTFHISVDTRFIARPFNRGFECVFEFIYKEKNAVSASQEIKQQNTQRGDYVTRYFF
jgi:hypothetical protein